MRSLQDTCLHAAWSQWVQLGVSGMAVVPRHGVDLEALLVFTAALADVDPRLRDEALDWSVRHGKNRVAVSRLRHVLELFEPIDRQAFGAFAATVNAASTSKWPTFEQAPRAFSPSEKSRRARLSAPALLQLRARKVFGLGARADIIANLLFSSDAPRQMIRASLLVQLGYTRRAITDVLDELVEGGVMAAPVRLGGTGHYRLMKRDVLAELLGPLPESMPPWPQRFAVVMSALRADRATKEKSALLRSVEIRRVVELRGGVLAAVNEAPPPLTPGIDPWPEIMAWLEPLLIP
jgi:hypothetical protein